jgi:flagellar M-ring protein FliF
MADAPQLSPTALIQGFNRLPNSRKFGLLVGLAATIAIIVGAVIWIGRPDYRVLYSNLSEQDGGAIIAALQQGSVPYKVAEGGSAILVPADKVYDARFQLAAQGLPRGGAVGFELMERQGIGITQFQEQVNYQRALEGELARSIQSLSPVRAARVHLAIPKPTVFMRERRLPSASVVVHMYSGRALTGEQVDGIVHIVSSSVPELPINQVTVVDQSGKLLSGQLADDGKSGLAPSQREHLRQVEEDYASRIESILQPLVGDGNVRAQVTAELDFTQVEQTAESFSPNTNPVQTSIRSQQSSESFNGSPDQLAQGVPGALSNRPPGAATAPLNAPQGAGARLGQPGGTGSAPVSTSKESTVNYELDKTIRHEKLPVGTVKRLSAAVVLNYKRIASKNGKVSFKPLSQEEMTQVNNLVREAIGFNEQRGDSLNIVNASFTPVEEAEPVPIWKDPGNLGMAKELGKNLLIAGLVIYLVLGVIRPILRNLVTAPIKVRERAGTGDLGEAEGSETLHAQPSRKAAYESDLQAAKNIAKQDPRLVANVVKQWVESE